MAIDLSQPDPKGLADSTTENPEEPIRLSIEEIDILRTKFGMAFPPRPLLSREQERALFKELRKNPGNTAVKNKLIESNLKLVHSIASYKVKNLPAGALQIDDLFQEGCLGLEKAIDKFDLGKDTKLSTYAVFWINQRMDYHIKKFGNTIRFPIHIQEKVRAYWNTESVLGHELGRVPSPEEIAERMELSVKKVEDIKRFLVFRRGLSLDETQEENDTSKSNSSLNKASIKAYYIDDGEEGFKLLMREAVLEAINNCPTLSQRHKEVLELRFGLGGNGGSKTLEEVGKIFNLTRERIRQLEAKALKKLRADPEVRKVLEDFVY